jgi:hypothetical protein
VCLGHETSMHYLSCSAVPRADPRKIASGHVTPNLCFYTRCDLQVTSCILVHLGCDTSMHYFSCSGGLGEDPRKNGMGHITPNLCFYIRCDPRIT